MYYTVKYIAWAMTVAMFALGSMTARTDTQVWNVGTGDWSVANNWINITDPSDIRIPGAGDDVLITNVAAWVLLTNSTERLGTMTISNAALVCSNWNTTIYVTNLTILSSGVLSCAGPFTDTAMSNRVSLVCTNLLIESGGAISVFGKGFSGGINVVNNYNNGYGPGGGTVGGTIGGASYGGAGGQFANTSRYRTGAVYGVASAPLDPGSGGKACSVFPSVGAAGGGAVRVVAGDVVVNGAINADASISTVESWDSGGSGGGIYITCRTITGTNGLISANGSKSSGGGGAGGGGRIAIIYDSAAQNLLPLTSLRCSAAGGYSKTYITNCGDIGTLYFPDSALFSLTNLFTGQWLAPGPTNSFYVADWLVSNVWISMPGIVITVSNNFTIVGSNYANCKLEMTNASSITCGGDVLVNGATFSLGARALPFYSPNSPKFESCNDIINGTTFSCAGNLMLTNRAWMYVFAGVTNTGAASGYGAQVQVGADVVIPSNCWISPVAHPTNGTVPLFSMQNLTIDRYGGFMCNGLGFAGGLRPGNAESGTGSINKAYGPGATNWSGGSGHGGVGTRGFYGNGIYGSTYGSSNAPVLPGSGARAGTASGDENGPWGGGSVQIRARDIVSVSGTISANAGPGSISHGAAASGGSIYITCRTFIGNTNGALLANGSDAPSSSLPGGGGGGGRIAVWRVFDRSSGLVSNYVNGSRGYITNGTTYQNCLTGDVGTIVWGWIVPPSGSIISVY